MKPFLKWAGGKSRLVPRITKVLPDANRLVEPFVGSGAMFMGSKHPQYLLGEINPDLINLYKILQTEGLDFIEYAKTFFTKANNNKDYYYQARARFNATIDQRLKSALFIYLNKHGFNGLCRYNMSGEYNVPFGKQVGRFPEKNLINFYHKSQQAKFIHAHFEETMQQAKLGDVIYCDPPYVPLSDSADFTGYSGMKFSDDDQQQLASLARECAARGVPVVISNHDLPQTRELYRGANITAFEVERFISCDGNNRKPVRELLAVFN